VRVLPFLVRRILLAAALVLVVSSTALLSVRLSPGDHIAGFNIDPAVIAAERHRAGLDRPLAAQYVDWLGRALRLDLGESLKYRRPVTQLVRERAGNTFVLGFSALILATLIGIPLGVITGSRPHRALATIVQIASVVILSVPPLVTSFALLLFALTTGWFPVGGFAVEAGSSGWLASLSTHVRYLVLPIVALALPMAASLERLESRAMQEALAEPSILAARARGLSTSQVIWRHGFRLSLRPVLAIYGVIVGSILSGSFVVEIVMSWPGLGALMYEALVARDLYLVAGCAAVGSLFLAAGVLASDVALALVDPRVEAHA
jgi:peptide/nickel transport system permease protein